MIARRRVASALVALATLALVAPASAVSVAAAPADAAGAESVLPVLAGKTTITADGIAGLALRVPEVQPPPELPQRSIDVTVEGGTFAFFGLNEEPCPVSFPEDRRCMLFTGYRVPAFAMWIAHGGSTVHRVTSPPVANSRPADERAGAVRPQSAGA